MKVRRGRTYLNGIERDGAEALLEDRAYEILGRVMLFPPIKKPPRRGKSALRQIRPTVPDVVGVSTWVPHPDSPGFPVKINSSYPDEKITRTVSALFAAGPMADDLSRFIREQRDILRYGLRGARFPSVIDRWYWFLLSPEGSEMAGVKSATDPAHFPMSDETIISITHSLLSDMGVSMKHSVLRQLLVRTRRRLGI